MPNATAEQQAPRRHNAREAREPTNFAVGAIQDERARQAAHAALETEREENRHELAMLEATAAASLAQTKANTRRWQIVAAVILTLGGLSIGAIFGVPVALEGFGVSVSTTSPEAPAEQP